MSTQPFLVPILRRSGTIRFYGNLSLKHDSKTWTGLNPKVASLPFSEQPEHWGTRHAFILKQTTNLSSLWQLSAGLCHFSVPAAGSNASREKKKLLKVCSSRCTVSQLVPRTVWSESTLYISTACDDGLRRSHFTHAQAPSHFS